MALLKLSLGITALATSDQLVKLVNEVFCSKRWLVYIKIAEVLCAVILLPSSASIAANVK
jgi:hypothetical protein